ncbi:hypothetical protein [Deinococcus cellulosilyticus]|uniref:Uncharacterized protein n=1 Tax=Deinococcus cellulosilyticus (strain DSM 18568 / NBRC 106333 / KACC 11606 / 5516J-15) TaxID=1223518 RepID=A0A511N7J3_DEIC1|nr:hypothetical protein [Deinococcus cellulosilyticus]GEM48815.1 hypothetical protein DC3_44500 [Deinococcus cellulosilyticus NBRC 106333 = KACC 11606]
MTQTKERAGWTKLHQRGQWHYVRGSWTLCGLAAAHPDLLVFSDLTPSADPSFATKCLTCERRFNKAQKEAK